VIQATLDHVGVAPTGPAYFKFIEDVKAGRITARNFLVKGRVIISN